ncbi:short-chain dehydrogenase [Aspergillus sclerotioniger CBS 115572]|uniref:Short-chain dehydrogenase n=1 Tax=Aspergillus sclerotioniger CBS 115572 TaxID=1450535 RepID=A0A317XBR2_9EURO|nr:short-chain dehydrogenase [Aspergillus sclerotioniger CBS 115572]PWY95122.1 short-chain dehydrogenase [Aspergillus sclerotioniger CBS 115572]
MASKVLALITGANQGIGFATARQLANSGKFHVLVGARSALKAEAAVKELESDAADKSALTAITIDVTDDASITAAAHTVSEAFGRLDILINNAGIAQAPDTTLREQYRQIFEVNVFGMAVVMDVFLPLLRASTYPDRRIVNVTSGQGLISRAGKKNHPSSAKTFFIPDYRSSKAAVNMITVAYSVNLADEKIAVIAAAPGYCRTNLNSGQGVKEASDGAKVVVRAATEGDPENLSGTYLADENWSLGW